MVWQKVVGHINGRMIHVESKDGNVYPAEASKDDGHHVYTHSVNEKNDWDLWAWIEFEDGEKPSCEYVCTGDPYGGPPKDPPWDL